MSSDCPSPVKRPEVLTIPGAQFLAACPDGASCIVCKQPFHSTDEIKVTRKFSAHTACYELATAETPPRSAPNRPAPRGDAAASSLAPAPAALSSQLVQEMPLPPGSPSVLAAAESMSEQPAQVSNLRSQTCHDGHPVLRLHGRQI